MLQQQQKSGQDLCSNHFFVMSQQMRANATANYLLNTAN